ncbi:MAG TPA: glycoside hydrolase family 43 protein, partial [Acidimicrobiales bacterium]
ASAVDFGTWSPVTDALPVLPRWAAPGFTWAPDVHQFGSDYVLYFTADVIDTGQQCIGIATSTSPVGPFAAEQTPFVCQASLGGTIDPRVFTDADGANWLLYKSDQNIGARPIPTTLWSQRLSADGLSLIGPQHELMKPDESWQGTIVEAPDMVEVNGTYWVFYAGNFFNLPKYAIGAARCQGPTGPCSDTSTQPLLSTNAQGKGPGEASVYLDTTGAWMLYTPVMATGGNPPRPVMVTRIGFDGGGPYLAAGGPPPTIDPLGGPVWSAS